LTAGGFDGNAFSSVRFLFVQKAFVFARLPAKGKASARTSLSARRSLFFLFLLK
jgi:hypothetical protein